MKIILSIAKALAIRSNKKTISSAEVNLATPYVLLDDKANRRAIERAFQQFLHVTPQFGVGSVQDGVELLAEGRSATTNLTLSPEVQSFIVAAGGIDAQLTYLVAPTSPATVSEAAPALSADVIGQPGALNTLRHALAFMPAAGVKAPRGVLFLVGPPATGKTFMASLLSGALKSSTGSDWHSLRVDFSRFRDEDEGFGLTGLRMGWGSAREGLLTGFVKQHPRSVVIIDNLDQGHPRAQESLTPVFDSGVLHDDYTDEDVDFSQTLWVFTSNLARRLFAVPGFLQQVQDDAVEAEQLLLQELASEVTQREGVALPALAPGLLSRLAQSTLVLLRPLDFDALQAIAGKAVDKNWADWRGALGVTLPAPSIPVLQAVLLSLAPRVDARRAASALPRWLANAAQRALDDIPGETRPRELVFALSDALALEVQAHASAEGLKKLVRGGRGLKLKTRVHLAGDVLTLTLDAGPPAKVANVADFQGAGGIRVEVPDIRFAEIHGHTLIKTRLMEIARLLGQPDAPLSRGMLLYGKPGTGKTMLAKAFANEADKPFIALTGPQLFDLDLLSRVFRRAREYAPAIVFIDEIDALGRRDVGGYVQHINQLLAEIDGFDSAAGVFVIAATNFPDRIDSALLRAGRLDLHIEIPALDREARGFFIDKILKTFGLKCSKPQRERLLDYSSGMTGAELERVRRETALLKQRHPDQAMLEVLEEAISIVKHGESNISRRKDDREHIAYHEAGHAVCSAVLNPEVNIEQVTIVPRGGSLGFVAFSLDDQENRRYTVTEVRETVAVMLAGRAAERLWAAKKDTANERADEDGIEAGAEDDLRKATALCYRAIAHWGMEPALGAINLAGMPENMMPHLAEGVMQHVQAWVGSIADCTEGVLRQNWPAVEKLAAKLLNDETVDGKVAKRLVKETNPYPSPCELPQRPRRRDVTG